MKKKTSCSNRNMKESSLGRREMIPEGIWNFKSERRTTEMINIWVDRVFSS